MICAPTVHIRIERCCHHEAKMMVYKTNISNKRILAGPENLFKTLHTLKMNLSNETRLDARFEALRILSFFRNEFNSIISEHEYKIPFIL